MTLEYAHRETAAGENPRPETLLSTSLTRDPAWLVTATTAIDEDDGRTT